jgi:hypothetical protein
MRRLLLLVAVLAFAAPSWAQTIVSVEHITMTLTNTSASVSVAPSLGQNLANTVPFSTMRYGSVDSTAGDFEDLHCSIGFSGSNVVMTRSAGGGNNGEIIAEVYLVEFNPTHWTVQSGTLSMTTTSTTASVTVANTARAFVQLSSRTSSGTNDSYYSHTVMSTGLSTTDVTLRRGVVTTPTLAVNWWVVEDISSTQQISVQRVSVDVNSGAVQTFATITQVDPERAWLIAGSNLDAGCSAGTSVQCGAHTVQLLPNGTQVLARRIASVTNNPIRAQVIEFVGDYGTVQRGAIGMKTDYGSPYDVAVSAPLIASAGTTLAMPWAPVANSGFVSARSAGSGSDTQALGMVSLEFASVTNSRDTIIARREFNTLAPPNTLFSSDVPWEMVDWGADPDAPIAGNTSFRLAWRESWASPIAPAFDAGWEQTGEAVTGYLSTEEFTGTVGHYTTGFPDKLTHRITLPVSSADQELAVQLISQPLAAGTVFTSGVTPVYFAARMGEHVIADNINQCIFGLRVIDDDGSTVKATLLAVANYGDTVEFSASPYGTSPDLIHNEECVDGDTVTSSYTIEEGDYLVAEFGFQSSGTTDADPQAYAHPFDGGGIGDVSTTTGDEWSWPCTTNESDNKCYGQLTVGATLTPRTDDPSPGPTRLYLPFTEAAAVSPATSSILHDSHGAADYTYWEYNNELIRRRMVKFKGSSTTAIGQTVDTDGGGSNLSEIDRQYVSDPMVAGITFTKFKTHITAQIRGVEVNAADSVVPLGGVRIYSEDGTTLRATLLGVDFYWGHTTIGTNCGSGCYAELGTTFALNETIFKRALVQETYTTVAGDRLVYELGGHRRDVSEVAQFSFYYGETDADCDETDSSSVTACSPWIEFSNNIDFTTDPATGRTPRVIS